MPALLESNIKDKVFVNALLSICYYLNSSIYNTLRQQMLQAFSHLDFSFDEFGGRATNIYDPCFTLEIAKFVIKCRVCVSPQARRSLLPRHQKKRGGRGEGRRRSVSG